MDDSQLCRGSSLLSLAGGAVVVWSGYVEMNYRNREAEVQLLSLGQPEHWEGVEAGGRLVGSRGLKGLDVAMKSGREKQEGQEAEKI